MKYRFLTNNELELLEDDFHHFLHEEGIKAKEWKEFNSLSPENAQKLLAKFSDRIFSQVLKDVEYLEHRSAKSLRLFECRKDSMIMIGLDIGMGSEMDFTNPKSFELTMENQNALKSFQLERKYELLREDEIYHLMECGCYVVDGKVFNQVILQRKSAQN